MKKSKFTHARCRKTSKPFHRCSSRNIYKVFFLHVKNGGSPLPPLDQPLLFYAPRVSVIAAQRKARRFLLTMPHDKLCNNAQVSSLPVINNKIPSHHTITCFCTACKVHQNTKPVQLTTAGRRRPNIVTYLNTKFHKHGCKKIDTITRQRGKAKDNVQQYLD